MNKMNIKELAEKYELGKDDFWEHRKGTWIIKHDACMKIAHIEGIDFDKPEYNYNIPTTFTENGEKVQQVKYGRESWKPAWAGTCQKHTGGVSMVVWGYKKDNPDYKIWTTGEADASNCTSTYYGAMAEKRGKDRIILMLIDAYQYGIYSELEADDFERREKAPTDKQLDMLHNLASELEIEIAGVDKLSREEVSVMIDNFKEKSLNKRAEEKALEKQELIKE